MLERVMLFAEPIDDEMRISGVVARVMRLDVRFAAYPAG
jgi:hypothetical protein